VDAGLCNGIYFINGVGIGFDGEVVRSMRKKRMLPGHLAYLATVLKKIFLYREQEMKINIGNRSIMEKIFMLSIANGSRYGGGFLVAPQSKIDDGLLDIVAIKKITPVKRIFYLPKVEKGKHLHLSFIDVFRSKKISIESNQLMRAHLDGEYFESFQINVEVLPAKFFFLY
jgi:diacylglycerol kinase (ATP)